VSAVAGVPKPEKLRFIESIFPPAGKLKAFETNQLFVCYVSPTG